MNCSKGLRAPSSVSREVKASPSSSKVLRPESIQSDLESRPRSDARAVFLFLSIAELWGKSYICSALQNEGSGAPEPPRSFLSGLIFFI